MKTIYPTLKEMELNIINRAKHLKGDIAIIGGHYAIDRNATPLTERYDVFGIFPQYTLDLSCRIYNSILNNGKGNPNLVLLVDDHSQMRNKTWYLSDKEKDLNGKVEHYFNKFSFPKELSDILNQHSITEDGFLKHKDGIPFQESYFRKHFHQEIGIPPSCAGEYRLILEELSNQGIEHLIGFIPLTCQGPTCNSIVQYGLAKNQKLNITHVYLPTNHTIDDTQELEDVSILANGGIVSIVEKPGVKKLKKIID